MPPFIELFIAISTVTTACIVPLVMYMFKHIKTSVLSDCKQMILEYYTGMDDHVDSCKEQYRYLKDRLEHLKEIQDLKNETHAFKLAELEKRIGK
jgi:hypothetical protein